MENPSLPNPDQQRFKWVHFALPDNVIPFPRPVPEVEHDDFISDLPNNVIEVDFRPPEPPEIAA